jgi:hypothetical protein
MTQDARRDRQRTRDSSNERDSARPAVRIRRRMKGRLSRQLAVALFVAFGLAGSVAAAARPGRGPCLLVSLPSLGTVTWSCGGHHDADVALGFRVSVIDATTTVKFAAGKTSRRLTLQPGQSTRFPLLAPAQQRLTIEQGTEARTLRASVVATFSRDQSYCFRYFPPRISVTVWQARQ